MASGSSATLPMEEESPQKLQGHPSVNNIDNAPDSGENQPNAPSTHYSHSRAMADCSPARSKRGSPADATDDEGDFQRVSHQRKKKGPVLPPRHSMSRETVVDAPGPPTTTSSAAAPTNANLASLVTTTDPNVSAHASQLAASTRYALSRFPFPPVTLRFKSLAVKSGAKKIMEEISAHFSSAHLSKITFLHGRPSNVRCDLNETDLLLYAKDVTSFATLLDQYKWPPTLGGEEFSFPSSPSIPPQLAIIIRNVDASVDVADMLVALKESFPSTRNVIRLKNKFGNDTDRLKVELSSPVERQALLDGRRVALHHTMYSVGEYLAPASVLICSKCCGIGHFRRQCTETLDSCKKCGQSCPDMKAHQCSAAPSCKHCNGDHLSNSLKCPVIRSFRAELTRKLLNSNTNTYDYHETGPAPRGTSTFRAIPSTLLPVPSGSALASSRPWPQDRRIEASMSTKLDSLINGLAKVHETLNKVCESNARFERFMVDQHERVRLLEHEVSNLQCKDEVLETELAQCKTTCAVHQKEVVLIASQTKKLILPIIDDVLLALGRLNKDSSGRTLDAELHCRFERYRAQVTKAVTGKSHSQ